MKHGHVAAVVLEFDRVIAIIRVELNGYAVDIRNGVANCAVFLSGFVYADNRNGITIYGNTVERCFAAFFGNGTVAAK